MELTIKQFYEQNDDFKGYVDRYCKMWEIDVDTAIEEYIVIEVAKSYMKGGCNCGRN